MHIRCYEVADELAVVSLWNEVLSDSAPHNEPATIIRKKLAVEGDLFFVAVKGDIVVGTLIGGYDGHRGWVYSLAVRRDHQRQGIGTALVRHLEAALADLGCLKVNLQVRSSNADVVAFYRSLAYDVEERISGTRLP